jgi:hypothetical protein
MNTNPPSASARSAALFAAVAIVALAATGCSGSSSGGSGSVASSSPPHSTHAVTSPVVPTLSAPASSTPSTTITQAELDAALLSTSDIGPGFKLGTYQANPGGGPCEPVGTPSVDQRVPPAVESGRAFDSTQVDAELVQEAAIYDTPAEAARAFALAVHGTSCRHGTLSDGTEVNISVGQDVTAQVNAGDVGKSTAWQLSNKTIRGVIVATLAGRVANACIFVAAADVDTSKLPNPVAVAKIAFDKLRSH